MGLVGHESALKGGVLMEVPDFGDPPGLTGPGHAPGRWAGQPTPGGVSFSGVREAPSAKRTLTSQAPGGIERHEETYLHRIGMDA